MFDIYHILYFFFKQQKRWKSKSQNEYTSPKMFDYHLVFLKSFNLSVIASRINNDWIVRAWQKKKNKKKNQYAMRNVDWLTGHL